MLRCGIVSFPWPTAPVRNLQAQLRVEPHLSVWNTCGLLNNSLPPQHTWFWDIDPTNPVPHCFSSPDGSNSLSLPVKEVSGGSLGLCEAANLQTRCPWSQTSPRGCWSNAASTGAPAKGLWLQEARQDSPGCIPQAPALISEGMEIHCLQTPKDQKGLVQSVLICHCSKIKGSWWEEVV